MENCCWISSFKCFPHVSAECLVIGFLLWPCYLQTVFDSASRVAVKGRANSAFFCLKFFSGSLFLLNKNLNGPQSLTWYFPSLYFWPHLLMIAPCSLTPAIIGLFTVLLATSLISESDPMHWLFPPSEITSCRYLYDSLPFCLLVFIFLSPSHWALPWLL